MTTPPTNYADRVRERRGRLRAQGYSAGVAGALAAIDRDAARNELIRRIPELGVKDGVARAYAVRLVATTLKLGQFPSAPSTLTDAEAAFIRERAGDVAREIAAVLAEREAAAKIEARRRREAEDLERDLTR